MRVLTIASQHPDVGGDASAHSPLDLFRCLAAEASVEGLFVAASHRYEFEDQRRVMAVPGRSDEILVKAPQVDAPSMISTDTGETHAIVSKLCDLFRPDVVHIQDLAGMGLTILPQLTAMSIPAVATIRDGMWVRDASLSRSWTANLPSDTEPPRSAAGRDLPSRSKAASHIRRKLIRRHLAHVAAVAVPSQFVADSLTGLADHIEIIRDPLAEGWAAKQRRPPLPGLTNIAVWAENGDFDTVLAAVDALDAAARSKLRMDLFGEERGSLAIRTEPAGEFPQIRWPMIHSRGSAQFGQLRHSLVDYDWLLIPSSLRATNLYTAEAALFAGTPVIAGDGGGFIDVISERENGAFFTEGSSTSLSKLLRAILLGVVEAPLVDREQIRSNHSRAVGNYLDLLMRAFAARKRRGVRLQ